MSGAIGKKIDDRAYGRLLSRERPRAIRNDKELEDMTAELLRLDELEENGKASPEEREFAELLTILIEHYEAEHYPIEITGAPHENLAALMELKEIPQSKIAELIGSRSIASVMPVSRVIAAGTRRPGFTRV